MELRKKSRKKWKILVLLLLFFLLYFNLDFILAVKHFSVKETTRVEFEKPNIKSYVLSYDVYTSKSGISTTSERELIEAMEKNGIDIAIVNDCGYLASKMEGVYGDKVVISKCFVKDGTVNFKDLSFSIYPVSKEKTCPEIYNLTRSVHLSLSTLPSLIKFFTVQLFDKENAYRNLTDFVEINFDISRFEIFPCFISGVGHYSKIKILEKETTFSLLDINYTLSLVKNKVYLDENLTSDIEKNKQIIFKAIKNGHISSIFSDDFKGEVFIRENKNFKPVGSLTKLSENPEILVKTKKGNILTAVYKNGKLKSVYTADSFVLKPESAGVYSFVVYSYSLKLPFGIYLGVKPVAYLGNTYFQ